MFSRFIDAACEFVGFAVVVAVGAGLFVWIIEHNYPNADLAKAHIVKVLSK